MNALVSFKNNSLGLITFFIERCIILLSPTRCYAIYRSVASCSIENSIGIVSRSILSSQILPPVTEFFHARLSFHVYIHNFFGTAGKNEKFNGCICIRLARLSGRLPSWNTRYAYSINEHGWKTARRGNDILEASRNRLASSNVFLGSKILKNDRPFVAATGWSFLIVREVAHAISPLRVLPQSAWYFSVLRIVLEENRKNTNE